MNEIKKLNKRVGRLEKEVAILLDIAEDYLTEKVGEVMGDTPLIDFVDEPSEVVIENIRTFAQKRHKKKRSERKPKFKVGDTLYFMDCNAMCSMFVRKIEYDFEHKCYIYYGDGCHAAEEYCFKTTEDLFNDLKKRINERED